MDQNNWCISGTLPPEAAHTLTVHLEELAFEDAVDVPTLSWFEGSPGADWQVDIFFYGPPDMAFFKAALERAGLKGWSYSVAEVEEKDWVSESQKLLSPVEAGRFFVFGSHDADKKKPDYINLQIDAGQAFGTGKHETTAACLTLLSQLADEKYNFENILDVGTGSGVLALAAHKLWPAAKIMATDIDPIAVTVSQENIAINGGLYRSDASKGAGIALAVADGFDHPAILAESPYALIVANILAGPLIDMAPDLTANLKTGGLVILSGLLISQKEDVLAAYSACGLKLAHEKLDGDWAALQLIKS